MSLLQQIDWLCSIYWVDIDVLIKWVILCEVVMLKFS